MSIDTDIFAKAGIENTDKDEDARRAVKAFRALQPTLSAYARILTKKPSMRVEMAARDNGSTDGNKIYYRPPIALGSPVPHERRLCDKRDDTMQPACPACAIRERVLTTIYHEIAHICFDSFSTPTDRDRANLITEALKQVKSEYAERVKGRITLAPDYVKQSYIGLAGLINEFLPLIVNGLEDARVNRELFKARKGTKVMFDAETWHVFNEGVEQKDGDGNLIVKRWDTYPLNLQVIVGVFCKASGYDYASWFVPPVVEALDDEELTALIRRLDTVRSVASVYQLSFPVLARLRELGFCATPEDPDETDDDGDEESDEAEQGESGESSEQPPEDSEPDPAQGEGSGEGEPDESDEPSNGGEPDPDAGSESGSGQPDPEGEVDPDAQPESGEADAADPEGSSGGDDPLDSDAGGQDADDQDPSDVAEPSDGIHGESAPSGDPSDESDEEGSGQNAGDPSDESGVEDADSQDDGELASGGSSEASDGEQSDDSSGGLPSDSDDGADDADGDEADVPEQGNGKAPSDELRSGPDSPDDRTDASGSGDGDAEGSLEQREDTPDEVGRESTPTPTKESESGHLEPDTTPEERPDLDGEGESDDPIDTGADDGQGGTQVIEKEEYDDLPMGDPDEAKAALLKWMDHEDKPKTVEETAAEEAVDRAIIQGIYFETPSRNIYGVREHRWGQPIVVSGENMSVSWDHGDYLRMGWTKRALGIEGDFDTSEAVLGPALMRMRVAFADNQRGADARHRKSGRVDGRVLGKRAPMSDPRVFKKKILPGKKNYFVLIGVDVSGSTVGINLQLEKKAVFAQAQLCHRMGIDFAIYAHSGNYHDPSGGRGQGLDLDMYVVKERHDAWDTQMHERLFALGPDSCNLDGHSLEYYRKRLDEQVATDKILLYYTDGKMPAENHDEELEILQREIKICAKKGYTLLGVGIRTDSPIRHGLDTVQVDEEADVVKVVKHLEKRLLAD